MGNPTLQADENHDEHKSKNRSKTRTIEFLIVFVVMAILIVAGAWVRCGQLNESLWLDELHTSWVVSGDFSQVSQRAAIGNQSSLYFWLVWFLQSWMGHSESVLRLVSLISGILLIPISYWLARVWSGSTTGGIVAAALLAMDPNMIYFSGEARPYSLIGLAGFLQVHVYLKLIFAQLSSPNGNAPNGSAINENAPNGKAPDTTHPKETRLFAERTHQVGFVVTSVFLFYLHYTTAILFLAEAIIGLAALLIGKRLQFQLMAPWGLSFAAIGLSMVPAISNLNRINGRRENWLSIVEPWPIPDSFLRILCGYVAPVMVLVFIWGLAVWIQSTAPVKNRKSPTACLVGLGTVVVVIGGVWLSSYAQVYALLLPRYVVFSLPIGALVVGSAIGLFRQTWLQIPLGIVLICIGGYCNYHFNQWVHVSVNSGTMLPLRVEQWRAAVGEMQKFEDEKSTTKQPVFLAPGLIEDGMLLSRNEASADLVEYCQFPLRAIYQLSERSFEVTPLATGKPFPYEQKHLFAVRENGGAWVVARGFNAAQFATGDLQQFLLSNQLRSKINVQEFQSIVVVQLVLESELPPKK